MSNYGKEPWNAVEVNRDEDELIQIRSSNGGIIARLWIDVDDREFSDEQRDNARRIVACVNACRGVSSMQLSNTSVSGAILMLREASQQRDELLAALEHILGGARSLPRFAEEQARAAIAKAKGSAA